jgi:hypothetical protein
LTADIEFADDPRADGTDRGDPVSADQFVGEFADAR